MHVELSESGTRMCGISNSYDLLFCLHLILKRHIGLFMCFLWEIVEPFICSLLWNSFFETRSYEVWESLLLNSRGLFSKLMRKHLVIWGDCYGKGLVSCWFRNGAVVKRWDPWRWCLLFSHWGRLIRKNS